MTWVNVGIGVAGIAANLYTSNKNSKAMKGAQPQPLDIAKVIEDARTNAAANYAKSFELERQFRPGTAALRTQTDASLSSLGSGLTPGFTSRDSLLSSITSSRVDDSYSNPLLEESANSILDNLRLGGALGRDVQEQAVKAALEKGGTAGISGSGAVRGLVARDLGLASMGLLQQRQQAAQAAGTNLATLRMQEDQLKLQDYLGRLGAASGAANQDIQRTGLLASIIDARALPESGLSPGAIANLYVGDKNAQDQARMDAASASAARNNSTMNSLLGFGSMAASAYFGRAKSDPNIVDGRTG